MSNPDRSPTVTVAETGDDPDLRGATASSTQHVAFGVVGLSIGLVLGLFIGLVAVPLAGSFGDAFTPSRIPAALSSCDVDSDPWITPGDGGSSLSLQSVGEEAAGADVGDIVCVLNELDIPDSVLTRMSSTRALDGRQSGEWDEFSASWGYHPDNGLDVVIETVTDH